LALRPLDASDLQTLKQVAGTIADPAVRARVVDAIRPVLDNAVHAAWDGSIDIQKWRNSMAASESQTRSDAYKARLTDGLVKMMCRPRWAPGAVATGLVKRAVAAGFRGEASVLSDRLRSAECPAAAFVNKRVMQDLTEAIDAARGH
jgi:hypothetical protein